LIVLRKWKQTRQDSSGSIIAKQAFDLRSVIDVAGGHVPRKLVDGHLAALGVVAGTTPIAPALSESACGGWLRATSESFQSASCTFQEL
jgi:hypothetical protein